MQIYIGRVTGVHGVPESFGSMVHRLEMFPRGSDATTWLSDSASASNTEALVGAS